MNFSDLGLSEDVLRAVADAGYTKPTPIQAQAIPVVLMGRDLLGCAQTGTGKTASFTLPMIDILAAGQAKARMPRSLILEPTRELATQVAQNFEVYGKYHKLNKALLIGGESLGDQVRIIERGADVLIATPGRLIDLFDRGRLLLRDVKILVIDEADRMLDMGFIPDVERIVSLLPRIRQTLFFSATLAPEIRRIGAAFLMNPKEVSVGASATPAETVTQGLLIVRHGDGRRPGGGQKEKRAALRRLMEMEDVRNALVFCNRKRDVGVLYRSLTRHGYNAGQLHGDMSQPARTETLQRFKAGEIRLLVCSDVAARGLDIQNMSHVFNFDVPSHAEDYVHRIGRTGRAGREGRAFTLATPEDGKYLDAITRLIGKAIPRVTLEGVESAEPEVISGKRGRRPRRSAEAPGKPEEAPARPQEPASGEAAETGTKRSRRRRGGRGRRPERHAEPAPAAPAPPASAAKEDRQAKKEKPDRRSDKPVVGMGDHVPAFMLRPAHPPKKN